MLSPIGHAGVFLIGTLFGIYLLAIMLRFLLQTVRADFYNPLVQFLVTITNPVLVPMRRIIPGLFRLDLAALVLMFLIKLVELGLIDSLLGTQSSVPRLIVLAVAGILSLLINVLFWAVLIQVILSWVRPDPSNPVVGLLYQLTEPLLRPVRGLIPPISGLDLSPMVLLIGLQVVHILVVYSLEGVANSLT